MNIKMGPYNVVKKNGEYDVIINIGDSDKLIESIEEYKSRNAGTISVYCKTNGASFENDLFNIVGVMTNYDIFESDGTYINCTLKLFKEINEDIFDKTKLLFEFIGTTTFAEDNKTIVKNMSKISAIVFGLKMSIDE